MSAFELPAVRTGPPPPPARIRPFDAKKDLSFTRYLVGASVMEPSSSANQTALFKPLSLFVWAASCHFLILRFTSGYPPILHNLLFPNPPRTGNPDASVVQTLTDSVLLLPVIIAPAIALLAFFELRHRAFFEMEMRRAIGEEDLRDIAGYYDVQSEGGEKEVSRNEREEGASAPEQRKGFWVLEYDDRLIGAIALDGFKPGQRLDSVVDRIIAAAAEDKKKKQVEEAASAATEQSAATTATDAPSSNGSALRPRGAAKSQTLSTSAPSVSLSVTPPTPSSGTAPAPFALDPSATLPEGTLHLRRFATSLSFRSAGIEDDLLGFAAEHAFAPSPASARSGTPAPAQQLVTSLRPAVQKSLRAVLERNGFMPVPRGSELDLASSSSDGRSGLLSKLWPASLEQRTMVLKRSTWERMQSAQHADKTE
ncbi:hypothetical protein Rhopal_003849-T1 [Rhodotorula paludigena]|uniref:Proteophosphoglycan ppg4 n=1 Tax=Rhodotorula paludigena TaxID=86838 RepID=A0AAV5GLU2_9BASI|nr:hypothetical protein Rhopal_003849-T1 [Rhodotorula paludigena]